MAEEYAAGEPFPLVIIDGFLDESFAEELLAEFPPMDGMARSNDYMFGDKRERATLAEAGPASRKYHELLMSAEFTDLIAGITGRTLFMDPAFHGGGFHQSGDGGFLDTHVDFNIHPDYKDWLRVLNVLLYLNKDWPPGYGGALLVRTDPKTEPRAIAPLFNRCVMMLTSDNTYHGFRKMSLPPGVTASRLPGTPTSSSTKARARRAPPLGHPREAGSSSRPSLGTGPAWPRPRTRSPARRPSSRNTDGRAIGGPFPHNIPG